MRRTTERQRLAYHEAGHAVAAFVVGRAIRLVTIEADRESGAMGMSQNTLPKSLRERPAPRDNPKHRAFFEKAMIINFAGPAAEKRFCGRWSRGRAGQDLENADGLARMLCDEDPEGIR